MAKKTYVERIKTENKKLMNKLKKLKEFMSDDNEIYSSLPEVDKALLTAQAGAMVSYSTILEIRLNREQAKRELREMAQGAKVYSSLDELVGDLKKQFERDEKDGRNS